MKPPIFSHRHTILATILMLTLHGKLVQSASFFDDLVDAVQNVGDFLSDLGVGTTHVLEAWRFVQDFVDSTIDEDCEFKCKLGYKAVNNSEYIPSSDGCGSLGVKWDAEHLPVEQLADCCDNHDLCYDTCGSDRDFCDLAFKKCLYTVCDRHKRTHDKYAQKACKGTSKLLYTGTLALGCKSYKDAQKRACRCVRLDSNKP